MTPDERAARIHHHEYSGEGIREHAERIVALEELVLDMWDFYCVLPTDRYTDKEELDFSVEVFRRIKELEIEVDG